MGIGRWRCGAIEPVVGEPLPIVIVWSSTIDVLPAALTIRSATSCAPLLAPAVFQSIVSDRLVGQAAKFW